MYAFWLGPVGPTDKKSQVKMHKKYCLGTLRLWNSNDPDLYQTVRGSGSVSDEKQDPDPCQSESRVQIHIKRGWIRNTGE